jgi:hypothetical protein
LFSLVPIDFSSTFFTEELLAKFIEETNLYSSQINPNKTMNCTVYGTKYCLGIRIITSMTPPSNSHYLCNGVLGVDLVKGTVSKRCLRKFISAYISKTQTAQFSQP